MRVRFFDPHPGMAGAVVPLPLVMKKAVDELSGKELTLDQGAEQLQDAGKCLLGIVDIGIRSVPKLEKTKLMDSDFMDGWISMMWTLPDGRVHVFRLLRFRVL